MKGLEIKNAIIRYLYEQSQDFAKEVQALTRFVVSQQARTGRLCRAAGDVQADQTGGERQEAVGRMGGPVSPSQKHVRAAQHLQLSIPTVSHTK